MKVYLIDRMYFTISIASVLIMAPYKVPFFNSATA